MKCPNSQLSAILGISVVILDIGVVSLEGKSCGIIFDSISGYPYGVQRSHVVHVDVS